jgi:hypothetical protein
MRIRSKFRCPHCEMLSSNSSLAQHIAQVPTIPAVIHRMHLTAQPIYTKQMLHLKCTYENIKILSIRLSSIRNRSIHDNMLCPTIEDTKPKSLRPRLPDATHIKDTSPRLGRFLKSIRHRTLPSELVSPYVCGVLARFRRQRLQKQGNVRRKVLCQPASASASAHYREPSGMCTSSDTTGVVLSLHAASRMQAVDYQGTPNMWSHCRSFAA